MPTVAATAIGVLAAAALYASGAGDQSDELAVALAGGLLADLILLRLPLRALASRWIGSRA
jgi:hypothetical protein